MDIIGYKKINLKPEHAYAITSIIITESVKPSIIITESVPEPQNPPLILPALVILAADV